MARTFVQQGDTLTFTAPTGGVTNGVPLLIGTLLVIPENTVAQTLPFDAYVVGVHSYTKTASQAWTEGQSIYWNTSTAKFDNLPSTGPLVGVAVVAVGSGAGETTGVVRLATNAPASGGTFNIRTRFTTAQINAGATLLPALAGGKYRMIDASAMAYGGAATGLTTFDILGTLSGSRKLVAFAQASLTQSTVLDAGTAGAAVLADGASYTANDVNTAITVAVTGSALATATGIDVVFTYAIDPA